MASVAEFFAFARERESIRLKKAAKLPKPWTADPVLARWYFCNIFREDDRTTVWFRENIRDPLRNTCKVAIATVIARWFNYIPTMSLIRDELVHGGCDVHKIEAILRPTQNRGEKIFTGAFVIKSPNGFDKLTGILLSVEKVARILADGTEGTSLQAYHEMLCRAPFLGPFMAYQIVCDLRYTAILEGAPDINTWTCAGPGSARGLQWLEGDNLYSYTSASGQKAMVAQMQRLLTKSRQPEHWPEEWRPWELSTVQHTLCEYDKYLRAKGGEHMKRGYR